ncbi:hypothetical protein HK104_006949, partial [Borealophlyctis nickersoniae]
MGPLPASYPPPKRITLQLPSTAPSKAETVLIPLDATPAEIRSVLLDAAEVGDGNGVIVKLRKAPQGGQGKGELVNVDGKCVDDGGVYAVEIVGATRLDTIQKPTTMAVSPSDIEALKKSISSLKLQIEELDKLPHIQPTPPRAIRHISKIDPRYSAQPKYIFTEETRAYLKTPQFDNWQWEENEMLALLEFVISEMGLTRSGEKKEAGQEGGEDAVLKLDVAVLKRFLQSVKDHYNLNMYGILNTTGIIHKLKPLDKLILVLSAIGH